MDGNFFGRKAGLLSLCVLLVLAAARAEGAQKGKGESPFIVATDYPSLQAAVDAVPPQGGTVYLPPGTYVLSEPLDLTGRTTITRSAEWPHGGAFIRLVGAGQSATMILGDTKGRPIIDMTFTGFSEISDMRIRSTSANVGILLGRERPGGGSAGHNLFRNLLFEMQNPAEAKACVYSMGSEVNRFINCVFSIHARAGTCFYFTPRNPLEIKSTYVPTAGGGCNTELAFYGCTFCNRGEDSVGLRVEGYSSDIRLYGGYFSNQGFAAISLDGTQACLDNVSIQDVRIEGEWGKHCLFTKGYTRNVRIQGGDWISSWGPVICQEPASTWDASKGEAYAWRIENLALSLWVGHAQKQREGGKITYWEGFEQTVPFYEKREGEDHYTLVRFHNLRNSAIDVRQFAVPVYWEPETEEDTKFRYAGNVKAVVVENISQGNTFLVQNRGLVHLKSEDLPGNKLLATDDEGKYTVWHGKGEIVAPDEEGTYRTYLLGRCLLNLPLQDVTGIKNPKRGDVAIDATAGIPRLAIFDGQRWQFFSADK